MNTDRTLNNFSFSLPTADDLAKLYKEKGEDALVWYAWRNLLRALPMLGILSKKEISYGEFSVSHYYHIVRFAVYLSFWSEKKEEIIDFSAVYEACEVLKSICKGYVGNDSNNHNYDTVEGQMARDKSDIAGFSANTLEDLAHTLSSTIELLKNIQSRNKSSMVIVSLTESIADSATHAELSLNALNVGIAGIHEPQWAEVLTPESDSQPDKPELIQVYNPAYMYASKFVDPIRDQQRMCINEASARADFNWLEGRPDFFRHRLYNFSTYSSFGETDTHLKSDNLMDEAVWNSRSLYSLGYISEYGVRDNIISCTNALLNRLTFLNLKFLSDDLRYLWRGYKLGDHAERYLSDYSTLETQNAESLKKLILEGLEADHVQAVRILLVGPGGAGKSSLADLLQGKSTDGPRYPTQGIELIDNNALDFKTTYPELSLDYEKLEFFLWDFGGQVIQHGLHSTLFHENCIYILVVDSRHEQAPDDWLYQIQHLAGFQAKVLIVTNIYEGCSLKQNENRLIRQFPSLVSLDSFFYFSCIYPNDKYFENFILKLIEESQNKQRQLLVDSLKFRSILEETFLHEIFISIDKLELVISEKNNTEHSAEYLIEKLVQLGFLIPVDDDLTSYCLKPDWLIEKSYALIKSQLLSDSNGSAALKELRKELRKEFNQDITLEDLKNLVSFLQVKGLCQKLDDTEGQYFFPESSNTNEPVGLTNQSQKHNSLIFRFDLNYLPMGYHKELVNGLFKVNDRIGINHNEDIWREGFIFQSEKSQARVQYFLRKSIIEVVLSGEIEGFAELLDIFYKKISKIMVNSSGTADKIYVSLQDRNGVISHQSCESLVHFLSGIDSFQELHKRIREMSGKKVTYETNITNSGDGASYATNSEGSTLTSNVDKRSITISDSQQNQLKEIVEALLLKKDDFSQNELRSVKSLNQLLDHKSNSNKKSEILVNVWNGLDQSVGFVSNATQIAGYVQEHWGPILAIVTAVMNNIPLST